MSSSYLVAKSASNNLNITTGTVGPESARPPSSPSSSTSLNASVSSATAANTASTTTTMTTSTATITPRTTNLVANNSNANNDNNGDLNNDDQTIMTMMNITEEMFLKPSKSSYSASTMTTAEVVTSMATIQPETAATTTTVATMTETILNDDQQLINQILTTSLRNAIEHNCTDLMMDGTQTKSAFLDSAISSLMYNNNNFASVHHQTNGSISNDFNTTNNNNNNSTNNQMNNGMEWLLKQTFNDNATAFFSSSSSSSDYSSLYNSIINAAIAGGSSDSNSSSPYCPSAWDGVSCWHRTMPGQQSIIPCFNKLLGIHYDTNQNATRLCLPNGTWAERADYSQCKPLIEPTLDIPVESLYTSNIYYFGYGLSLIGLSIALFIFLYFKDLRCRRNTIHTNLMITYLLIALCWIITDRLHVNASSASQKASCITVIILTYLMGTNFSWMFVEGLYLYILVVKTFSIKYVNITNYLLIGWLSPAIIILFWSLVKFHFSNYDSKLVQCPYQAQDEFDYIYKVPILVVLIVNIFFLGKIMWVLIIKLRASNSIESKQYRKAAKALLVLIPLLGVGYILVLVTPTHPTAKLIFQYLQAILVSTQGFTVAVLYCFCNGDVRHSLRVHFNRFRSRYGGEYPGSKSQYYRTSAYLAYHNSHPTIKHSKNKQLNHIHPKSTTTAATTTASTAGSNVPVAAVAISTDRFETISISENNISTIDKDSNEDDDRRIITQDNIQTSGVDNIGNGRLSCKTRSSNDSSYTSSSKRFRGRPSRDSFSTTHTFLGPSLLNNNDNNNNNNNDDGDEKGNGSSLIPLKSIKFEKTEMAKANKNGYHSVSTTPVDDDDDDDADADVDVVVVEDRDEPKTHPV